MKNRPVGMFSHHQLDGPMKTCTLIVPNDLLGHHCQKEQAARGIIHTTIKKTVRWLPFPRVQPNGRFCLIAVPIVSSDLTGHHWQNCQRRLSLGISAPSQNQSLGIRSLERKLFIAELFGVISGHEP